MKILVLCAYGRNRSRYVANYLSEKGYDTDFDGVLNGDSDIVQKKINDADVLITVSQKVHDHLVKQFNFKGKRVIEIDVEDRPEFVLPACKPLSGDDWVSFQEQCVYPDLIDQLNKFLPITENQ